MFVFAEAWVVGWLLYVDCFGGMVFYDVYLLLCYRALCLRWFCW